MIIFMIPKKIICLVSLSKVPLCIHILPIVVFPQFMGNRNLLTFLIDKVSIENKNDRICEIDKYTKKAVGSFDILI